jgi:hypothetical protein
VDQTFTTLPVSKRCQDNQISDPLSEPPECSGSFVRYQKRLEKDRYGAAVLSSSHETIKGLFKDASRPTVSVGINTLSLDLPGFIAMIDTLNDGEIWGVAARCMKLSTIAWQRKLYGTCSFYFTRRFDFEIRFDGFDEKEVADCGYKKFRNGEDDDRGNPEHYVLAKDLKGNNPPQRVLLDGDGNTLASTVGTGTGILNAVFLPPIEVYEESNFYALGIPSSLTST